MDDVVGDGSHVVLRSEKPGPVAVLAGGDDDEAQRETAEHDEDRRDRRVDDAVGDGERLDDERHDDAQAHDADPEDGREGTAEDEAPRPRRGPRVEEARPIRSMPMRASSITRNRLSSQAICRRSSGSGEAQWAKAALEERPEARKSGPRRPLDQSGRAPRAESRMPV